MKQGADLLHMAVYIFLFFTAFSYVLRMSGTISLSFDMLYGRTDYGAAREASIENSEILYTEADILAFLMLEERDADIEVNHMLITSNAYHSFFLVYSEIEKGQYSKNYLYDETGKLIRVIYEKCT